MSKFAFFLLFQFSLFSSHYLTFIIPCYNCEEWIKQAVDSIYQQDLKCPFEIICTDDCSTDKTLKKLYALQRKYCDIQIHRHEKNKGGGATRNTCVFHSKGDIIFCLDADNVLAPQMVQKLIDKMDETKSDIVSFGKVLFFRDNFVKLDSYTFERPYYTLQDILIDEYSPPHSGNYLFTRQSYDLASGYPEEWGSWDTYTFGFFQLLHNCKMTYAPDTYYWHRQGIESYSVQDERKGAWTRNFYLFILAQKNLFTADSIRIVNRQLTALNEGRKHRTSAELMRRKLLILTAHEEAFTETL